MHFSKEDTKMANKHMVVFFLFSQRNTNKNIIEVSAIKNKQY